MNFNGCSSSRVSKFDAGTSLIAGIGMLLTVTFLLSDNEELGITFFFITFFSIIIMIIIRALINVSTDDGVPHEVSDYQFQARNVEVESSNSHATLASQLRKLRKLRTEGLITSEDYKERKRDVLREV